MASLRVIHEESCLAIDGPVVDIIGIPGISTPPVQHWEVAKALLAGQQSVDRWVSKICILSYEYNHPSKENWTWESFLAVGNDLLDLLFKRRRSLHGKGRNPIIFICHSLGGLILKKALNSACLQREHFQDILEKTLGIIFLGTPHTANNDSETLERYMLIVQGCSRRSRDFLLQDNVANELFQLCNLAVQFEKHALPIPLLSVYDGKDTKIGRRRLFKSICQKLVDIGLARTQLINEKLVQADAAHVDLCRLPDIGLGAEISSFTQMIIESLQHESTEAHMEEETPSISALDCRALSISPTQVVPATSPQMVSRPDMKLSNYSTSNAILRETTAKKLNQWQREADTIPVTKFPCRILPRYSANPDFFDRIKETEELDSHLLPRSNGQKTELPRQYAICGMGGVGKTEIAVEWFYRSLDQFQAMFWIDAAEPSQLAASYANVATALGIYHQGQSNDLVANREVAKLWFARAAVPWLIVFDNADHIDSLLDYWPSGAMGSILITSRDPVAKTFQSFHMPGLDLEPFLEEDAAEFARITTGSEVTEKELQASFEMARQLGRLPLAITHMAGIMRRRQWSVNEFVEKYEEDTRYKTLRQMGNIPQVRRYGNTLATAWNFNDLDSNTVRLLRILAFLSPDRIQERLFIQAVDQQTGISFFAQSDDFENAKEALLSSSVIKRNRINKELFIHRIIAQEVRACMNSDDLYENFSIAIALMCSVWPFNHALEKRHATSRWKECEELFPHLEHLHKLYETYRKDWAKRPHSFNLVLLFQDGGAYLHERGFSFRGKSYLEDALELFKRIDKNPPNQKQILSDIYYTLGAIANEINDGKSCLENNIILLKMREEIANDQGRPDVRLAAAHSQIGIAYMMMGKRALATEYFKQSIEIFKSLEHFQIDMLGFPMANLGFAYWLQGQLDEAEDVLATALGDREKAFGKMDQVSYKTGRILHGYGNVKTTRAKLAKQKGDMTAYKCLLEEGRGLHEASLAQLESTLGRYHHRVADLCHRMAGHFIEQGDHDLAQEYLDRALKIWGKQSWYRNQVARTSFLKGKHLLNLGKDSAGKQWISAANSLRKEILPTEEPAEFDEKDYDELVVFWSR